MVTETQSVTHQFRYPRRNGGCASWGTPLAGMAHLLQTEQNELKITNTKGSGLVSKTSHSWSVSIFLLECFRTIKKGNVGLDSLTTFVSRGEDSRSPPSSWHSTQYSILRIATQKVELEQPDDENDSRRAEQNRDRIHSV
jgi:hypothetical protein